MALFCLLSGLVFTGAVAPAQAATVELVTPRTGTTILARDPEVHLVLRQAGPDKPSQVRVERTGDVLDAVVNMVGETHTYLHFRLPLVAGTNRFTILPSGKQVELKYRRIQAELKPKSIGKDVFLFHLDDKLPKGCDECHDLQESETLQPSGLKKQTGCAVCHADLLARGKVKHGPAVNEQCLTCHQQSVMPWRIGFPPAKIQDVCFICHTSEKAWFSRSSIHGPIFLGGCTLCHNPHGEDNQYMLWDEGSLRLCLDCHSDKENLVRKKNRVPYVHGIIFGKGCTACHDPHATDQQYMLIKPINELCVGCHPQLAGVTQRHPVDRHPVSAPTEHRRPGHKLTCVGCHDPHGSNNQYMLVETKMGARLCRVCHKR